jgi:hypothetical protein
LVQYLDKIVATRSEPTQAAGGAHGRKEICLSVEPLRACTTSRAFDLDSKEDRQSAPDHVWRNHSTGPADQVRRTRSEAVCDVASKPVLQHAVVISHQARAWVDSVQRQAQLVLEASFAAHDGCYPPRIPLRATPS